MAQETSPLMESDEEVEKGLGSYICCRAVASLSVPAFESHRHKLLWTANYLSALGVFLTTLAYIGAFGWGTPLSYLSWTSLEGPRGTVHAGVAWVCYDRSTLEKSMSMLGNSESEEEQRERRDRGLLHSPDWHCGSWGIVDCSILPPGREPFCGMCKSSSSALTFTVFISVFTYYGFYKKTHKRLNGEDCNFTKFMACFCTLVAGVNFLVAILAYWESCVRSITDAHAGPGLICMTISAVLKVLMGFIHLGLPVEHASKAV